MGITERLKNLGDAPMWGASSAKLTPSTAVSAWDNLIIPQLNGACLCNGDWLLKTLRSGTYLHHSGSPYLCTHLRKASPAERYEYGIKLCRSYQLSRLPVGSSEYSVGVASIPAWQGQSIFVLSPLPQIQPDAHICSQSLLPRLLSGIWQSHPATSNSVYPLFGD